MMEYDDKQTKTEYDDHNILGCWVKVWRDNEDYFRADEKPKIGNMSFVQCRYCGGVTDTTNIVYDIDGNPQALRHESGCSKTSGDQE